MISVPYTCFQEPNILLSLPPTFLSTPALIGSPCGVLHQSCNSSTVIRGNLSMPFDAPGSVKEVQPSIHQLFKKVLRWTCSTFLQNLRESHLWRLLHLYSTTDYTGIASFTFWRGSGILFNTSQNTYTFFKISTARSITYSTPVSIAHSSNGRPGYWEKI